MSLHSQHIVYRWCPGLPAHEEGFILSRAFTTQASHANCRRLSILSGRQSRLADAPDWRRARRVSGPGFARLKSPLCRLFEELAIGANPELTQSLSLAPGK